MSTEAQIRQWVREEREAIKAEEQAVCLHAVSGTMDSNGEITCDQCRKVMTLADSQYGRGES